MSKGIRVFDLVSKEISDGVDMMKFLSSKDFILFFLFWFHKKLPILCYSRESSSFQRVDMDNKLWFAYF